MIYVSISELKKNPSSVLSAAGDYPVAVHNRNKTAGYIVGKEMFEKLIELAEDIIDKKAVESLTEEDYKNAVPIEDLGKELGLE